VDTRLFNTSFITLWAALQFLACTFAYIVAPQARAGELCVLTELHNVLKSQGVNELTEFLETASYTNPKPIEGAELSGAVLVELPNGMRAILRKSNPGIGSTAESDVAAYKLDRFFGGRLHVPVTVYRTIDGKKYSLQVWIEGARSAGLGEKNTRPPYVHFFDYMTDNTDRGSNLLVHRLGQTESSTELVGVDHPGTFRNQWLDEMNPNSRNLKENSWSQTIRNACKDSLGAGAMGSPCANTFILAHAPTEAVFDQLKSTPESAFQSLFENDLSKQNIDAFLFRRREMIKVIDEALVKGFEFPE
jgi:hypothetical protein